MKMSERGTVVKASLIPGWADGEFGIALMVGAHVRVWSEMRDGKRHTVVNWSGCGDRDAGFAAQFTADMTIAVEMARELDADFEGTVAKYGWRHGG